MHASNIYHKLSPKKFLAGFCEFLWIKRLPIPQKNKRLHEETKLNYKNCDPALFHNKLLNRVKLEVFLFGYVLVHMYDVSMQVNILLKCDMGMH